ncbi:MAG: T9SS type A sorting domain-containing protein, partial [Bacteroidota bacterium]
SMLYGIDRRSSGTVNDTDVGVARYMVNESELPYARAIPIRTLFAQMREAIPGQSAYRDSWHMHRDLDKAIGGYMYTLLTGDCAVGEEPADPNSSAWRTWMSHKIGYETAWTMMTFSGIPPCGLVTLPVELVDFTVSSQKQSTALLQWTTTNETQNQGFYVERSVNGVNWEELSFIAGQGTTAGHHHYTFEDNELSPGLYYYRLRQEDYDVAFNYSPVRSIAITTDVNPLGAEVFPNPVSGGHLSVTIAKTLGAFASAELFDLTGRSVLRKAVATNAFTLDVADLPSGIYWLKLHAGGDTWKQKVLVR